MFSIDTLKSKTFWGIILLGAWNAAHGAGAIPIAIYDFGNWLIGTFTGAAAIDRTTKMIEAARSKEG